VIVALVGLALLAPAVWAVPTVNGLFFGDGDYQEYLLLGNDTDGGSRGKIYYRLDGSTLYIALVVSKAVNDAVFGVKGGGPSSDGAYMGSADWNPVHSFQRLYGSDHATFGIECGATGSSPDWAFVMDLLHDEDGDMDPAEADFTGDPFGGDGGVTALPPGFQSSTSLAWSMNNTLWDVTLGGTRNSVDTYKSPDQGTIGDITDDSYDISDDSTVAGNYNAALMWEWALTYEFSFDVSSCTTNVAVSPGTSHNSPAKDAEENITFPPPPEISTTYVSVSEFATFVAPGGDVMVEWRTDLEAGTVGFRLERSGPGDDEGWVPVGPEFIPGLLTSPQGGTYRVRDRDAAPGVEYSYRLIEIENTGGERVYGPYLVTAEWEPPGRSRRAGSGADVSAQAHPVLGRSWVPPGLAKTSSKGGPAAAAKGGAGSSGPVELRLAVSEDGMVHVSADDLASAFGLPGESVRGQMAAGRFRVTSDGADVAWTTAPEGSGILFYGRAIDSLYATENVYWITAEPGLTMEQAAGAGPAAAPGGTYVDTLHLERDVFAATLASSDPEVDYWFWDGAFDDSASLRTRHFTVTVPDALAGYELSVDLVGATVASHPVELTLNGVPVASGSASGFERFTVGGTLPSSLLSPGANTVSLTAVPAAGQNIVYIDGFRLTYERPTIAVGDSFLVEAEGGAITVEGFTQAAIQVFDVTDPLRPVSIEGITLDRAADFRVSFDTARGNRYLAVASGAFHAPAPMAMERSLVTDDGSAVDYLLITSPELAEDAQALADYRRDSGYAVRTVTTDEIYRAMSHGIVTPHAIRDFLTWSREAWGVRYAALVGMASLDYRGLQVPGESMVPTLMTGTPFGLYACDACLAESDGEGGPEVALGRIPAASGAEVAAFVEKLRAYETGSVLAAQGTVLLLADRYDRLAGDFARDSDRFADRLPPSYQSGVERIYVDDQVSPTTVRQQTLDWLSAGSVGWINYLGHGGMTLLGRSSSQGFLRSGDSAVLAGGSLPVVTALSCSANRFEVPGFDSLGEELVLDPDGGAIAVFAPTGLSLNGAASPLGNSLAEIVFDEGIPVLGDAIVEALKRNRGVNLPFMLRIYTLLGDPATRLR
jgi:hypothetical protein